MIVYIPAKYAHAVKELEGDTGRFFRLKKVGDNFELQLFTGLSLDRTLLRLTEQELRRFCNDIKVVGGVKKREAHHIQFIPKRPVKITVRFSEHEVLLIKEAAKREGTNAADYVRQAALSRILVQRGE